MVRALEFCYSSNQMSCASLMGLARRKLLATYRGFLPLNSSGWRLRVAVGRSRLRELTGVIPVFGLVRPGWVTHFSHFVVLCGNDSSGFSSHFTPFAKTSRPHNS